MNKIGYIVLSDVYILDTYYEIIEKLQYIANLSAKDSARLLNELMDLADVNNQGGKCVCFTTPNDEHPKLIDYLWVSFNGNYTLYKYNTENGDLYELVED